MFGVMFGFSIVTAFSITIQNTVKCESEGAENMHLRDGGRMSNDKRFSKNASSL